jgi:uncharacterized membrane protein YidH (DUF202 family)|tara:strand:+ start:40273 stop:40494 length:222 start_codon:yes stop_codon:yes gene_type:complete
LKKQVVEKIAALMIAAFGLVAALAWNDTIKAIFKEVFPSPGNNIIAMLVYAVVVTVIAVLGAVSIGNISEKLK